MSQTAVMDRGGRVVRHLKPKVVTAYESIRVLLEQNSGQPMSLGEYRVIVVPSSGSPDSPPFYLVLQSKTVESLWLCHCRDFRFRGTAQHDCDHIKRARGNDDDA